LHLCGYVGVPSTHPWFTSHHDDLPPNIHAAAHGGLTYTGEESGFNFFGFDCAHADDLCPGIVGSVGTYRDLTYVTAKVNTLADALHADALEALEAAPQLRDALEAALDALEIAADQCGYIDNRREPDDDITYICEYNTRRDLLAAAKAARQALETANDPR
jgi:hypothetical protein